MLLSDTPGSSTLPPPFSAYAFDTAYDEMFDATGKPHPAYKKLFYRLLEMPLDTLQQSQQAADMAFLNQGITFTVYGNDEGTERIWPYDLLPRIITAQEWAKVEKGLAQRITALDLFLNDIYHDEQILSDGVIPRWLVYSCRHLRREMRGLFVRSTYIDASLRSVRAS